MPTKTQQFFVKISKFPKEVQFYLENFLLPDFIKEINFKHNIKYGYLAEVLEDLILEDFNFSNLEKKLKTELNFEQEKINQIIADFLGTIVLPMCMYLKKIDIKKELEKYGKNVKQYEKYTRKLMNAIEDEKINLLDKLIKKHEELVNPEEEEEVAINLVENNLVDILKNGTKKALLNLNSGLIYLLFNKEGFKEEINKILLSNEKKLTHKNFVLDNKPHSPNIANWLKDFIKQKGSGMFNNIVLADFITNSKNTKNLDYQERKLVQKLLQLYRNLKFFPESMQDVPAEQWEIIPVDKISETMQKARTVSTPKTDLEKQIEELKQMASQYPEGSLERKAIEEEMEKLKVHKVIKL